MISIHQCLKCGYHNVITPPFIGLICKCGSNQRHQHRHVLTQNENVLLEELLNYKTDMEDCRGSDICSNKDCYEEANLWIGEKQYCSKHKDDWMTEYDSKNNSRC